ncbi:MAG: CBS domain-containing protein [Acidobacteriota bacterium]|nr:CBS domain-containing protein [Acidobacteriota bacterium]
MKVRDVMTTEVGYCLADAPVTQAAEIMWQRDCGVVPVVDENQRVIGMITDRDICFAAVTKNRVPSEIKISEVISQNEVQTCAPGDAIEIALKTLKRHQLRRLPVVNKDGVLVGILSLADLIRNVGKGKNAVPRKRLLAALKEISHLRPITLHAVSEGEENESDVAVDEETDSLADEEETDENDENESEEADDSDDDEDEDESDDDSEDDDSDDEDDSDDDSDDNEDDEDDDDDSEDEEDEDGDEEDSDDDSDGEDDNEDEADSGSDEQRTNSDEQQNEENR